MEGAEKSGVLSMTNAELEGRQKYISEQAEKRNELLDAVASQLGIQRVRLASGGSVPGFGNGDTVPALLTPGEFVINKNAVSKFGINNLEHINRYANGGVVSYFRRGTNNAISAGSTSYAMPNIDFQQFESGVNLFNEAVSSFNENSGSFSEIISNFNANILESSNLLDSTLSNFVSGMSEVSASLDAVITKIPSTFTHDHNFGGNLAVSIQADIQTAVNDIIASFQQEVAMAMEQLRGAGM